MTEKDPSSLKLRWTGISQRFGASRSALPTSLFELRQDKTTPQAGHTVKSKKCKGRSIFLYSNDIYLLVCYQKLNSYPFTRRRFKI